MADPSEAEKAQAKKDASFFERFTNAAGGTVLTMTAAADASPRNFSDPLSIVLIAVVGLLGVISNDRKDRHEEDRRRPSAR
jgi:hypothetical protein